MDKDEIFEEYRKLAIRSLKYDGLPITEEAVRDLAFEMMQEDDLADQLDAMYSL